jgi:hypothetical protein
LERSYTSPFSRIPCLIALGVLALSAVTNTIVLFPRLPRGQQGLVFWENILSHKSLDEYKARVFCLTPRQVEAEYASQNFFVSIILHRKYKLLRWSIAFFLAGVLVFLSSYLFT